MDTSQISKKLNELKSLPTKLKTLPTLITVPNLKKFLTKYWVVIAIILIMGLGMHIRLGGFYNDDGTTKWPYLRNIDSYNFLRHMEEITNNNGVLPNYDPLPIAPDGSYRNSFTQDFYVYLGAYSFMFYKILSPQTALAQFLIWFPALLASLIAVPMYFIGKILYDRKAGVIAALFIVFDIAIMSRTLAGDPDSDSIVLLMPVVVIAMFLITYKYINEKKLLNKTGIIYSILTGISLAVWGYTWSGYWFVIWLITGFISLKFIADFLQNRNIKQTWLDLKHVVYSYGIFMLVMLLLTVPFLGVWFAQGMIQGPFSFGGIKGDEGDFPNVYVSVAELQQSGGPKEILQRTGMPFITMFLSLGYLFYSYRKSKGHLDTIILLSIWFIGPFIATITAIRFSTLFAAPIAIGGGILFSKLIHMARSEDKSVGD